MTEGDTPQRYVINGNTSAASLDRNSLENFLVLLQGAAPPDIGWPRVVQFISTRAGEGTTTIARQIAVAMAEQSRQRTLLLCAWEPGDPLQSTGLLRLHDRHILLDGAVVPIAGQCYAGHLFDHRPSQSWIDAVSNPTFWSDLRASHAIIVIDSPPLASSKIGLLTAAKADCVVMVVEAEATRVAAVLNLRNRLLRMGANVIGSILTKQRQHIPPFVQRRLFEDDSQARVPS